LIERRCPLGAELLPRGGAHFRVWAPIRRRVEVVLEHGPGAPAAISLESEPGGYWSGASPRAAAGTLYRFRLDGDGLYPDPASRFQPEGPHGPSRVVDPCGFRWSDAAWHGIGLEGQVLYELHVGSFTPEGVLDAARLQLPELASCGITAVELMPLAEFPGRFGWGYDGVALFAPSHLYGEPDDVRRFVDDAHGHGIAVILDVVYNHVGPDGNYLRAFSPDYFTDRYQNAWGEAINFDGPSSGPVREFFLANAAYWVEEFHMDGLRLDATHQIFDSSPEHILAAMAKRTREAAGVREVVLVAENESQQTRLARALQHGGYGLDALWNDDFHHSAMVALTGCKEAYYEHYPGKPQEFVSAAKYGYLYQGQRYSGQKSREGSPAWGLRPAQFVNFLENHDQVSNSGQGKRVHMLTTAGRYRAATALLLLLPGTPLLFQGQEFAASAPFCFFADHVEELRHKVREGRAKFLSQFRSLATPKMQARLADPGSPSTFEMCKLDLSERQTHAHVYQMHKDLLRLRRDDPVFRAQRPGGVDGAVLAEEAFVLRFFGGEYGDRLLLVNFGRDLRLDPAPEPLLAPPEDSQWQLLWTSEDPRYCGRSAEVPDTDENRRIPGHAALVFSSA